MKRLIATLSFLALATLQAAAQQVAAPAASRPNALVEYPARGGAKLTVTTAGWTDGGDIPFENTQYRSNTFPGLAWSAGPRATKSYAVIMQDTDGARNGAPILHWTLYNIPAAFTKLDPGMAPTANPPGSSYGPNYKGDSQAYLGPRTPPGPKHHYHLQVFALDIALTADPAITYDGLTGQMNGHILASGEVLGLGQADPSAPPPPPRAPRPAAPPAP